MAKKPKLREGEKLLRPVRPNAGFEVWYRKKLQALVDQMCASVERLLTSNYKDVSPEIDALAADAAPPPKITAMRAAEGARPWVAMIDGHPLRDSVGRDLRFSSEQNAERAARRFLGQMLPADELQEVMADLSAEWTERFDAAAEDISKLFARGASKRAEAQMRSALRDAGFTVRMRPTPGQINALRASIHENVGLIKSIPQQYLKNVEGAVMRSVVKGRDLSGLTEYLVRQRGVTRRRAAFIARDQNNKATSDFVEQRRSDLGIEEAIWLHSHGGKKPRPTHVAMDGKRYKIAEGMYDSAIGKNTWPGREPNCRCVSRAVIPRPVKGT